MPHRASGRLRAMQRAQLLSVILVHFIAEALIVTPSMCGTSAAFIRVNTASRVQVVLRVQDAVVSKTPRQDTPGDEEPVEVQLEPPLHH